MNYFSRATSAFILTASLLLSSVAAVAQTQDTKQADPAAKTTQTQSEQKDPKEQKKTEPAATQPVATVAKSNKPLSTDEDPAMIGKRNINHGIIAKMSGSTE